VTTKQEYPIGASGFPEWVSPDGAVRLIHGDCLSVLPTLESTVIDAIIADPPYDMGIERVPLGGPVGKYSRWNSSRSIGVKWDVDHSWIEAASKLNPQHWIVFAGYRDVCDVIVEVRRFAKIQTLFTWRKSNAPQMTRPIPRMDTEFAVWARGERSTCERMGEFNSSVIDVPMAYAGIGGGERIRTCHNGPAAHPAQKPIALLQPFVERLRPNLVLDPYTGSCSTGVACIRTGRKFIGIELEPQTPDSPDYFGIAVKRCQAELDRFPLFAQEHRTSKQLELL